MGVHIMRKIIAASVIALSAINACALELHPVNGDKAVDTKFGRFEVRQDGLYFRNREVPQADAASQLPLPSDDLNITYVAASEKSVAILMSYLESMACQTKYQWLVATKRPDGKFQMQITPSFGTCVEMKSIKVEGNRVVTTFNEVRYDEKAHKPKVIGKKSYPIELN